jgi:hypothetical protein
MWHPCLQGNFKALLHEMFANIALSIIIDFQWKHWYSIKSPKLAKEVNAKLYKMFVPPIYPLVPWLWAQTCSKRFPRNNFRWNMFQTHKKCFTLCLLQFEGGKKMSKMRISNLFLKTFMLRGLCSKLHEKSWKQDVRDMRIANLFWKFSTPRGPQWASSLESHLHNCSNSHVQ